VDERISTTPMSSRCLKAGLAAAAYPSTVLLKKILEQKGKHHHHDPGQRFLISVIGYGKWLKRLKISRFSMQWLETARTLIIASIYGYNPLEHRRSANRVDSMK
jgi:hypothetical protein